MTKSFIGSLLSRAQFALWSVRNPGGSFKEFYADSVAKALSGRDPQPSLGPNLKPGSEERARSVFQQLLSLGIGPDDLVVDFGCGTSRIGRLLIDFLEPGRYVGMDIDGRTLEAGRGNIPRLLLETKRSSRSFPAKAYRVWPV